MNQDGKNKAVRYDSLQPTNPSINRDSHGNARLDATLSSSGVFLYQLSNGSTRREYRPSEEVLDPISVSTLKHAAVTHNHPATGRVDGKSAHIRVGYIMDDVTPRRADGVIDGTLLVYSDFATDAILGGEKALSPGYICDVDLSPGISTYGEYDAVQRNIRYDHVAFMRPGENRQGDKVSIHLDSKLDAEYGIQVTDRKEPNMAVVKLDGKDFELPEGAGEALIKDRDVAIEAAVAPVKSDLEKQSARCDALASELKQTQDATQAKIVARVNLLTTAEGLVGKLDRALSDRDVQAQVVAKYDADIKLDGKSDEYVSALYDLSVKKLSESKLDGVKHLAGQMNIPPAGYVAPQDWATKIKQARETERKNLENAWKGNR